MRKKKDRVKFKSHGRSTWISHVFLEIWLE